MNTDHESVFIRVIRGQFMVSCLCPCRLVISEPERLDVPVSVVVSPVSQVAVAAVARQRVRLAAVAASLDALHAQLEVAVGVLPAVPHVVVVDVAVAVVLRVVVAGAAAAAALVGRDVLHVAPDRDLFAQQAVVVGLEPVLELVARLCLDPDARLAPGASVPSRDPTPDSHASS